MNYHWEFETAIPRIKEMEKIMRGVGRKWQRETKTQKDKEAERWRYRVTEAIRHRAKERQRLNNTETQTHRCTQEGGVRGREGIKVYPPFKMFAKLVNKNARKHQKRCTIHKKISQPLFTLPSKKWQKPHGLSPWIFKPCASIHRQLLQY